MYHLSCKPCFVDPFTQQNAVLINVSKLYLFIFFTAALKDLQEKIKHLDVLLYPLLYIYRHNAEDKTAQKNRL